MKKKYLDNIYNDLLELSSIDQQKRLWLNKDKNHVSSYTELVCRLFDDDCFDDFIEVLEGVKGLNMQDISEVFVLHEKLNSYDESGMSDEDILSDPEWLEIVETTMGIIEKWPRIIATLET